MNVFRADLHCHSTCSDGSMSPAELVKHAHAVGLAGLSITDHDSIDAHDLALPYAKQLGMELIPGVEFSASHFGVSIHVLGYSYESNHPALQALCQRQTARRLNRNHLILEKLNKLEMPLSMEEVVPLEQIETTIGRPHIAQAMVKKGYVDSIQQAFRKFLGEGKRAFVQGNTISVQETIDAIHAAQGWAILAHPHLIVHNRTLKQLLEMNFDGLECYYSRFSKEKNDRWIQIANKKNWLITGGSDFHGTIKPDVALGCAWIDQLAFQKIQKH
jgi:predicted metal-dependent phosphoesterase TrpH